MKNVLLAALSFSCLAYTATAADLSPAQPFEIYYGHALSGGVTVRTLNGGKLVIERRYIRDSGQEIIEPSPEAWSHFRKRLDRLGIWKWKKNYANWGVKDGTQWRVLLGYKDRTLDSSGSNAYPMPGGGTSKNWAEQSQHFKTFLKDVEDLIGRKLR
jgi:opacity protein-like surface antigen